MNSLSLRLVHGFFFAVIVSSSAAIRESSPRLPPAESLPARAEFPDPLVMLNGEKVTSAKQWNEVRRPELKAMFAHYMYGEIPPKPAKLDFKTTVADEKFLGGKATLKFVTISISGSEVPKIDLLVVTPNAVKSAPAFLALNFCGNHAIHADAARGTQAADWPIEEIISRGYALASFANADVDSDRAAVSDGVYAWLAKERTGAAANSATSDRGCIAGWAWGFQRCVDYLVTDPAIDKSRIAAVGHSRNGKTALLAAAYDERIALAIPHQAGCGGTAPNRVKADLASSAANGRPTVETVAVINKSFPHWFNAEFKRFIEQPEKLPFDQHELAALMAPRPVLFSNATGDKWANPGGQFDMLKAAEPVYKLLGAGGCDATEMPPEGKLVNSTLGYYIRAGNHSMTSGDWMVFLDFADRNLKAVR